ncbi:MAG: arylsulfatase [Rikenellaceae bacterium]
MNKQSTILTSLALVGVSLANAASKPNIVFILADDMGYGDVSYYDQDQKIKTPYLDQMCKEGVVFRDAHTSSSVSTPSRYSIITGRYNWRSSLKKHVLDGYGGALITPERETMASMLKKSGYSTAFIGKWHMGWDWGLKDGATGPAQYLTEQGTDNIDYTKRVTNGPADLGFDYSYGIIASLDFPPYVYVENGYPTSTNPTMPPKGKKRGRLGATAPDMKDRSQTLGHITDKACAYIKEQAQTKDPFFLYFPLTAPHTPIVPTAEFVDKSGLNAYGDFVLMVDVMIGQVMQAIKDAGIDGETLVVFTTDNGCSPAAKIPVLNAKGHFPNSIYRGTKADLFDGGHRVPCIVRYPDGFKHHEVNQTICMTDFYATFAKMAGYKLTDQEAEDSYDILTTMTSKKEVKPIREATVHHSIDGEFAIRQGDWKLLMSASSGGWSAPKSSNKAAWANLPPVQLYNMKTDPSEKTNLQDKYPEKVEELKALLTKYIKEGRSTPGKAQKNDGPELWEQLHWIS